MKITEEQIAERYASMTDEELASLDPQKLTPEAVKLRAAELDRRGMVSTPAQDEERARREQKRDAYLRRKAAGQRIAVVLVVVALLTEAVSARLIEIPGVVTGAIVVTLCILAIYVLRRRG